MVTSIFLTSTRVSTWFFLFCSGQRSWNSDSGRAHTTLQTGGSGGDAVQVLWVPRQHGGLVLWSCRSGIAASELHHFSGDNSGWAGKGNNQKQFCGREQALRGPLSWVIVRTDDFSLSQFVLALILLWNILVGTYNLQTAKVPFFVHCRPLLPSTISGATNQRLPGKFMVNRPLTRQRLSLKSPTCTSPWKRRWVRWGGCCWWRRRSESHCRT